MECVQLMRSGNMSANLYPNMQYAYMRGGSLYWMCRAWVCQQSAGKYKDTRLCYQRDMGSLECLDGLCKLFPIEYPKLRQPGPTMWRNMRCLRWDRNRLSDGGYGFGYENTSLRIG